MQYIYSLSLQKIGRQALKWFPPKKFYLEVFPKTDVVSITFESRYIHGQSLKETDFLTPNPVDWFLGDSLNFDAFKFVQKSLNSPN